MAERKTAENEREGSRAARPTRKPGNARENAKNDSKRGISQGIPRTVADLKPWKGNPRGITPEGLRGLKVSMRRFSDISGLVFNVRTGRLVAGHQRVKNLNKTSRIKTDGPLKKPDKFGTVGYGTVEQAGESWRVRFVDVNEDTELAMNVTANNPEISGHFLPTLDEVLPQLEEWSKKFYEETFLDHLGFDPANKVSEHWRGMPGFEQNDETGFKTITVHFQTEEDYKKFAELVGQKLTDKTRSIWFPYREWEKFPEIP